MCVFMIRLFYYITLTNCRSENIEALCESRTNNVRRIKERKIKPGRFYFVESPPMFSVLKTFYVRIHTDTERKNCVKRKRRDNAWLSLLLHDIMSRFMITEPRELWAR